MFEPIEDTTAPTVITEDVSNKTMIIEITYKYVNDTLDSKPVVIDFTKGQIM